MKNKIVLLLFLPAFLFAQTEHTVQPNTADPLSGAPNNFHFVYTNQTLVQKNKLFLFFPGTGAVPFNYKLILKHAANLGYHAIGLTYPNADAINLICQPSSDTACHSKARLEVFDGTDRHSSINVDVNNCIERRTLKLLQHLHASYPAENWSQYYSGNQIQWHKIIVSGHSQGGGHAGIISKIKQVDRVAMFAATDWIPLLNRNADWITWNGPTSANRYFGFTHQNDEFVNFSLIQATWDKFGMNAFGNMVLVDTSSIPFGNAHKLYTVRTPAGDTTQYHGSVVADAYTPGNPGSPAFAPVWTYMIEGNGNAASVPEQEPFERLQVYPNPVASVLIVNCPDCTGMNYTLYNVQGQVVKCGSAVNGLIDISELDPGLYMLSLTSANASESVPIVKA